MANPLKSLYRRYKNLFKIVFLSLLFTFVIIKFLDKGSRSSRTFRGYRKSFSLAKQSDINLAENSFAYASLLCDDVMIDATKVLINSLKSTTDIPFILLVLPQVKQTADLIKLGAKIQVISELEYPFKVNQEKIAMNKMCRYSKLHIWKFIQYKKIVFIDVDCLIVQVNCSFSQKLLKGLLRVWTKLLDGLNSPRWEMPEILLILAFSCLNLPWLHTIKWWRFT